MSVRLIEAAGISVDAGGRRVLESVDFRVDPGEIVTIVGPNGSGKTTLLRVLIGALKPSAGRVARARGLRIGYVPQRLQLDHAMPLTVARFLSLGGGGRAEGDAMLERVGIPGLGGRQMAELSGGQFQRAMLAHALLRAPQLLALDEPTQGLDQPGVAAFYRLIEDVRADLGCGIVLVSHDLHVVMSASNRVVCINGHVCCEGAPTVVSNRPEYRALFGLGTEGALALYRHEHDHEHGACEGHHHGDAASAPSGKPVRDREPAE